MNKRARVPGFGLRTAPSGVVRLAVLGFIAASMVPLAATPEAEAASYYTRKRVNGVWITGKFAKDGARSRHFRRTVRAPAAPEAPEPDIAPLPPVPGIEGLVREAGGRGDGPETTAAIPRAMAALTEPFPEPDVADARLARLKEALKAHVTGLVARAAEPQPAPAGPSFSVVGTAAAMPARPPELGSAGGAAEVRPTSAAAAGIAPRSVSYDFETGIKTTVFENSVVREPFDVAAMKALTPKAPAR